MRFGDGVAPTKTFFGKTEYHREDGELWYEYRIPAHADDQREIIRSLQEWIESLEDRKLVEGYAFNHYSTSATAEGSLNIRFDCVDEVKRKEVRTELEREVKRLLPDYTVEERLWDEEKSPDYVYKAYEFGSRCAFLFWDLVEKKRLEPELSSSFWKMLDETHISFNQKYLIFQLQFSHGLMNSLGIPKMPNEQLLHLLSLKESTGSATAEELLERIRSQLLPLLTPFFDQPREETRSNSDRS